MAPLLEADKSRKKAGAPRRADAGIVNALAWLARAAGQWAAIPQRFGAKSTDHDRRPREPTTGWGCTSRIAPSRSVARPVPPLGNPDRFPPGRRMVEVACRWFNCLRADAPGTQQWKEQPELLHEVAGAG